MAGIVRKGLDIMSRLPKHDSDSSYQKEVFAIKTGLGLRVAGCGLQVYRYGAMK